MLRLAAAADASALNVARTKEAAADYHEAENVAAAKELAAKIAGKTVKIEAKGGASGRMFGKITGKEVAAALSETVGQTIDYMRDDKDLPDMRGRQREIFITIDTGMNPKIHYHPPRNP